MLQSLVIRLIRLVVWFGWLSAIASAQLEISEVTETLTSDAGLSCIGNVLVGITSLLRKGFHFEMGAKDAMAILIDPKLMTDINEFGATDASVVMLCSHTHMSNSSLMEFRKYIRSAHDVHSILLKCLPLKSASVTPEMRECNCESASIGTANHDCHCIVIYTVNEITIMLARQMPGMLKGLSESLCLLPSLQCRTNGCHGSSHDLLHVEETENLPSLKAYDFNEEFHTAAVCEALDFEFTAPIAENPICICIPVHPASNDNWTKVLLRSFTSKDQADRKAIVMASDAMESYLKERRENRVEEVSYTVDSLLVPRIVEALMNVVETGWFKLDGFSSALLGRRLMKRFVLDSNGNGFAANAFLASALVIVNSDGNNSRVNFDGSKSNRSSVCQVLRFRSGTLLTHRTLSFIIGCVNIICAIFWVMNIAFSSKVMNMPFLRIESMPPARTRVTVIMVAIFIVVCMDCLELYWLKISGKMSRKMLMIWGVIVLETACIILLFCYSWIVLNWDWVYSVSGKWVYSVLQLLVWVKWATGSYLLGPYPQENVNKPCEINTGVNGFKTLKYSSAKGVSHGNLVYFSAFFLNAVLAGVRIPWAPKT